ncbi:MAG: thioesterase family protein, partial [Methylobacteriaceae bacterium]|nr:thioesterase family protein [Methylobacteriaceae bacterium]
MSGQEPDGRTPFSAIIQALNTSPDRVVAVPETWRQGRAMFGGLAASLCVQAAIDEIPDLPPLRSAQFLFVGPASETVRMSASLLRRGKSAVIASAAMTDQTGELVRAHLCFGNARQSAIAFDDLAAPDVKPPAEYPIFAPPPRSGAPLFFQNFEMRIAGKGMPFSGAKDPDFLTWMRFRAEADIHSAIAPAVALVCMGDAPPSSGILMFKAPAPISTVAWALDVLTDNPVTRDGFWLVQRRLDFAKDGYSTET